MTEFTYYFLKQAAKIARNKIYLKHMQFTYGRSTGPDIWYCVSVSSEIKMSNPAQSFYQGSVNMPQTTPWPQLPFPAGLANFLDT
jgi:hypothetical protein